MAQPRTDRLRLIQSQNGMCHTLQLSRAFGRLLDPRFDISRQFVSTQDDGRYIATRVCFRSVWAVKGEKAQKTLGSRSTF